METLNTHRKKGKGLINIQEEINTKKKRELKHNSDGWFFE